MTAARTAKTKRPDLSVTAVRREPSYVPCALPYALAGVIEVDSYVKNESKLMTGIGVKVLNGEVTRIVPDKKQVVLDDGTTYSYGKLIVATGAEPVVPPIPGIQVENVFTVRTPADIRAILDYRRPGMRVAVGGAGYIGIEVACMIHEAGHDVALVELLDRVLPKTADEEFSVMAWERLVAAGIAIHLGAGVERFVSENDGPARDLVLANGTTVPTDLVVLCLGVGPRLTLFEEAGIRTERDGVVVDDHMRTSAPDVYACGDCTHFQSFVTGRPTQGKLATNGIFQGKAAALNAIGIEHVFEGFINTCVTDVLGLRLGATGLREEEAAEVDMKVVTGTGVSRNAYPMFNDSREVTVKLVFERASEVVIGGQVAGTQGVAERTDLIGLAIHQRLKMGDLASLQHCAHPVQSGVPAHNPIVMAAEDAQRTLAAEWPTPQRAASVGDRLVLGSEAASQSSKRAAR